MNAWPRIVFAGVPYVRPTQTASGEFNAFAAAAAGTIHRVLDPPLAHRSPTGNGHRIAQSQRSWSWK